MIIIDPPNVFSPADEWRAFLASMERLRKDAAPDDIAEIDEQIAAAKAHLKR